MQQISELIGAARARSGAAAGARALGAGGMPPKKAEPLAGQRSIAAFFSAKPKPAAEVRSCRMCKVGLFQGRPWAAGRHPCRCSMSSGSDGSAPGAPHARQPLPPQAAGGSAAKLPKAADAGDVTAAKAAAAAVAEQPVQPAAAAQPSPAGAKVAAGAAAGVGPSAVRKTVKVFWPDEQRWFTGDITGGQGWCRSESM